jgi:large subunit ribosomal protein L25
VNLFGHNVEPLPLQCDTLQLKNALARTGTTGLVSLTIGKAKKPRSVMFREVQREPVTGELLHIDLYQVNMDEKIRVEVPVVTIGEAPALKMKENFLAHELNTLLIECLPGKIPNRVEVDLSSLMEAGQGIHAKDINLGEGITILNHPEQAVVKISIRFVEKEVPVEAVAAEVEAEAGAEAPEGEAKEEGAATP